MGPRLRKALYYGSPCILAALAMLAGLFYCLADTGPSKGWSLPGALVCGAGLIICLILDAALRPLARRRLLRLWLWELTAVAALALTILLSNK